jgi:hypothetical protein
VARAGTVNKWKRLICLNDSKITRIKLHNKKDKIQKQYKHSSQRPAIVIQDFDHRDRLQDRQLHVDVSTQLEVGVDRNAVCTVTRPTTAFTRVTRIAFSSVPVAQSVGGLDCGSEGIGFDSHFGQSKVRLYCLSILTDNCLWA